MPYIIHKRASKDHLKHTNIPRTPTARISRKQHAPRESLRVRLGEGHFVHFHAASDHADPFNEDFRWTPHPVIVTIRDNKDYLRVLLYS